MMRDYLFMFIGPNDTPPDENDTTLDSTPRLGDMLPDDVERPPMPEETIDETALPSTPADLADDVQEEQIDELNVDRLMDDDNGANQALYGSTETDYDREYYDNEDEHEYYDEDDPGYHPDQTS